MACSVDLADRLFGPGGPIVLVTDSNRVKQLAANKYGKKFLMINVTLQHVALTTNKESKMSILGQKDPLNMGNIQSLSPGYLQAGIDGTSSIVSVSGIDGYMATWVKFLLIARASAVHHSISGFSTTASQFCSVHKQFRIPNCEKW